MINKIKIKPVLRWAGGKTWLLNKLKDFVPENYVNYHEPFLGGGSVFFSLTPLNKSYLSDVNPELINFYTQLKESPEEILYTLKNYKNDEKSYYRRRNSVPKTSIEQAAHFLYLNRTCFNGIYRVNKNGIFNVPYGFRSTNVIEKENFYKASLMLKNSTISQMDFEKTINRIKKNDFIFLDPPYTVAHNNNGFVAYNQKIFSWNDQERLAKFINTISEIGAYYILTNADHHSIMHLYRKIGKKYLIERHSTISSRIAYRKKINEALFTNCI